MDTEKLIGNDNREMAKDNNHNFSIFMESLFNGYQAEIFVDTVLWVFRAYRSHGFHTTYWAANLNIWIDTLKEILTEKSYGEIAPFYNWLIINIPIFTKLTDEDLADAGLSLHH